MYSEKVGGMTIGKLAELTEVGVETIRYYERRGLLPQPSRPMSGHRHYPATAAARIRFVKRAQRLGFSLREIEELLALRVDPETTCGDVKARAEAKVDDIDGKIRSLREIKNALSRLVAACSGTGPSSACPIVEALEAED